MNLTQRIWIDGMKRYEKCLYRMVKGENCGKILDLGCGDGLFTMKIASRIGPSEIFGIEGNIEKANMARALGVKVSTHDLNQRLPFPDCSFDVIFSHFVIEHLQDVDNFTKEIIRILKKDGVAIIGTENLASTHNIFALLLGMQPFPMTIALSSRFRLGNRLQSKNLMPLSVDESPHIRVFSYQGLKDLFSIYSFTVEKIIGAGYPPLLGWVSDFLANIDPRHSSFNLIKVRKI